MSMIVDHQFIIVIIVICFKR